MKNLMWFVFGAVLLLVPVGLRVLTWRNPPVHQWSAADISAGEELFTHEWRVNDPLSGGDGLGPVHNATSCSACHRQGGVGGGGDNRHNVTTYVMRHRDGKEVGGVLHAMATEQRFLETLQHLDNELPRTSRPSFEQIRQISQHALNSGVVPHLSQRNTPALFGSKVIDEIPDRVIIAEERKQRLRWGLAETGLEDSPVGRAFRLADGRIGKFGWKAQSASLAEFVEAACANELGLGNPKQPQPVSLAARGYRSPGVDLTQKQCDQITAFCAALAQPQESCDPASAARVEAGKKFFHSVGCAHCHTPNLGSTIGLYSDLLLHRMGRELVANGSYNDPHPLPPSVPSEDPSSPGSPPLPDEWRTPPLWGVADSAPYLHDGRAATLHEAILAHGGQGFASAQKYQQLNTGEREDLLAFLKSLRAPNPRSLAQR